MLGEQQFQQFGRVGKSSVVVNGAAEIQATQGIAQPVETRHLYTDSQTKHFYYHFIVPHKLVTYFDAAHGDHINKRHVTSFVHFNVIWQ
jgi:hypothetical protein